MSDYLASPAWDNVSREITQPWGPTTLVEEPWYPAKNCHWHCGVDIGLVVGTPLKAARPGQVKIISYGLLTIDVSPTEADCYVHIDRACVTPGQWVTRGQLVAYSGAKVPAGGFLTGPHLHFEVQTGALNNPATSHDPIPVLGDDFMATLSQADADALIWRVHTLINNLDAVPAGPTKGEKNALKGELDALKAQIAAVPPGGGLTVDQSVELSAAATGVAAIESQLKAGLKAT